MDLEVVRDTWEMEGAVSEEASRPARQQALHPITLLGAVARRVLGAEAALEWLPDPRAVATPVLGGALRASFEPARLQLAIADEKGEPRETLALAGKSLAEAGRWLADRLAAGGVAAAAQGGELAAAGAALAAGDAAALDDVARCYGNAWRALACANRNASNHAPIRLVPESGVLHTDVSVGEGLGIGVSWSPGDASCPQPYFAVKPCPVPAYDADALPELEGGGEWRTSGDWFGAWLQRSEWIFYDAEQLQAGCAVSFLDSAIEGLRELLGGKA